jgi:hypothetical protein
MAVVSVGEIWQRRRSALRNGNLVHYLMWKVICDNPADGTPTAIGADGIPQTGAVFVDVYGNTATLTAQDCQPSSGADRVFEVQIEFTQDAPGALDDNPLNQPPTFRFDYAEKTEPYFQDMSTNGPGGTPVPVVNSAGDAFDQYQQREAGELTVIMGRNEATHDAVADDAYSHTVNIGIVTLDGNEFADGTLKLSPIAAVKSSKTLKSGAVINYYAKTYTFKARKPQQGPSGQVSGWLDALLDVGYSYSVGDKTKGTQTTRPVMIDGMPAKKPWPLDGSGNMKPNASDLPATLTFEPYATKDWSALNLS